MCLRTWRGKKEEEKKDVVVVKEGESISTVLLVSPVFVHTPSLHGEILSGLLNGHFCGNILVVKTEALGARFHKLLHAGF